LVRSGSGSKQEANPENHIEDFDDKVVSAVSEAFNNIAIHAYGRVEGRVELEIGSELNTLTIRLQDTGDGFNLSSELGQGLGTLRESHMGLEIMFACMDEVTYTRGGPTTPSVLTMTKRYSANPAAPTLVD
jgi:anti-sigma regulatory factor (Ser/Thr protein kinase)